MWQAIFQLKVDQTMERCLSVLCIHDDLCVLPSRIEYDDNHLNLMQVASNNSLIFKNKKWITQDKPDILLCDNTNTAFQMLKSLITQAHSTSP